MFDIPSMTASVPTSDIGAVRGDPMLALAVDTLRQGLILFDATDAERVAAARTAVRELYDRAAEWGCTGYRAHVSLVDHVAGKLDFNDHALHKVYARIKDALDPAGIFSPGNHGIWPGRAA